MDKKVIVGVVKSKTVTGIVCDGEIVMLQRELEKFNGQKVKVTIEPVK